MLLVEMFKVFGEIVGELIEFEGDCYGVYWIGVKLLVGEICVYGLVGCYLGSEMMVGVIYVKGDVDDWVGVEMCGGSIVIVGRVGYFVGVVYWGS